MSFAIGFGVSLLLLWIGWFAWLCWFAPVEPEEHAPDLGD